MSDSNVTTSPSGGSRFDHYASAFAVALSMAALFVSFAEVSSERAQQRASVWPHVEIGESYSEAGFTLRLTNKGVGPALMGELRLTYDGEPVTDIDQLIVDTIGEDLAFSYERYGMSDPSNSVVAPSDVVRLFSVDWDAASQQLIQTWGGRIDVVACYCSIHGDCWQTSLTTSRNERTQACATGVSL
ncbi:MAG: hypothetical protein AAFO81_03685 [Pseudomonadota bacterium]